MSTPKIYTSQQFQQEHSTHHCPRCNQHEDIYIQLGCGHFFCIVCMTFTYLKFKGTIENKNKIKCLQCQKLSELDEQLHNLIREVINKELGPIVKNQGDNNQSRMSINQTHMECSNNSQRNTGKYNLKSENEYNGGITPTKNSKCFYSKCQSPRNSLPNGEESCLIHLTQDISYICMTCGVKPLCYKCIKSNKHSNHDVKIVKKAMEIIHQKFSLLHLQTAEKIENIQLYQKRLYDRKLIFEERIQKSIREIKYVFASLERKIMEKSNDIIEEYQQFYESRLQEIQTRANQSSQTLNNIKQFQDMIANFLNSNEHLTQNKTSLFSTFKTVQKYEQIQNKRKQLFNSSPKQNILSYQTNEKIFQIHQKILDPVQYQNSQIIKNITQIMQSIEKMTLSNLVSQEQSDQKQKFNETIPYTSIMKSDILFNKNKTMALKNCSSRQQIHKNNSKYLIEQNFAKRIKINIPASLNTSRDKRDKKYTTKTQQDQRRLKSKANYKTEANTQPKNSQKNDKIHHTKEIPVPAYITKHLQKHHTVANGSRKVSPFNNGTLYMMQNLHSSKNNSKIVSKTSNILHNDDFNNRKKKKQTFQTEGNKQKKHMVKSAKHSQVIKRKK